MKFSFKLLLWTMIVMALGFGFSGYYFVNYVFQTSMDREVNQAMDESSILRFAFETAALNVPAKYDVLQDTTVSQIASNLESGGRSSGRLLRICDEQKKCALCQHRIRRGRRAFGPDRPGYQDIQSHRTGWSILHTDRYGCQCPGPGAVSGDHEGRVRGVSGQVPGFLCLPQGDCGHAALRYGCYVSHCILSDQAHPSADQGHQAHGLRGLSPQARKVSSDELGQLTTDFNQMANALEDNINQLEDEIQAREDFVAAFAHELKTPLTSIIGYADALRSRRLDEEKQFMSANYIYTEGKRLEAMSFRLLDIMVTRRGEVEFTMVSAESLFSVPV